MSIENKKSQIFHSSFKSKDPGMFWEKPICEECGQNEAISFSYIVTDPLSFHGGWKFVCECKSNEAGYYIPIKIFFSNPATSVSWLAHMNDKSWMNWSNFMDMIERFRDATGSFGVK